MEQYHPIINFIYFGLIIGCSMFFLHPVCLLVSMIGSVSYTVYIFGWERAKKGFAGVLVLMLLTALINPTFSHQGVTPLATLPSGNMLTLESILFGIGAACMLGTTLLWFRILGEILTADKIVYLFGRTFPVLGLLLSMILGFLPKVKRRYSEIVMSRRQELVCQERYVASDKSIREDCGRKSKAENSAKSNHLIRVKHGISNLSILVTWMLEDSVVTASSMRGRGYGLEGRTTYTIYRFTKRDGRMLLFLLVVAGYVLIGRAVGALEWWYYPVTGGAGAKPYSISVYMAYLLLTLTPIAEELRQKRRWKALTEQLERLE